MSEEKVNQKVHDVVIIGSGPAGYTAAIYTARADLKPVVIAGVFSAGGALMTTNEVENFPGFPEGIMGPDLMTNMQEQAERFGTEVVYADATRVELDGEVKKIITSDDEVYLAKTVILATGSEPRKLGLADEERLSGKGVSYCATCDGFFFKDKELIVVGGGDSAMEEATFLTKYATKVTVVYRKSLDKMPASEIMKKRALNNDKIEFVFDSEVIGINGDNSMESALIRNNITGEETTIPAAGMFVAIGHTPRTELISEQIDLDEQKYIKVHEPNSFTNIEGVFACGDVADHTYQQAITAAASGCKAAIDTERYLSSIGE
ncbi:thioredoxin-disulfide reductase [Actinomyces sp. zg-332]|uniref:thioredoxin-disulfide reductase n=1 Tax=Actinomyces sp. zg-332 TaxID=2708340 RepID=UPI0014219819|nr:thioredoxin-disulfide reductase [Actinomyces sp. zg-332]QPK94136.1 thioredoxin-disulfide reductase [Actinomyces sp. zg-332]